MLKLSALFYPLRQALITKEFLSNALSVPFLPQHSASHKYKYEMPEYITEDDLENITAKPNDEVPVPNDLYWEIYELRKIYGEYGEFKIQLIFTQDLC